MRLVPTESLGTEMRLDIGGLIPGPSRDLSVTLLAKVTHMCSLCENAPMVLVCVIHNVDYIQSQSSSKVMGHKACLLVLDLSVLDQFLYTLYKIQLGSARWIVRRDQFVKVMRGNTLRCPGGYAISIPECCTITQQRNCIICFVGGGQ